MTPTVAPRGRGGIEHRFSVPGHSWRVQSDERGRFDEVVVTAGRLPRGGMIFHAEMMDDRSCFVDVAGLAIWVYVGRDGVARISMVEDRRPGCEGELQELRDKALDKPRRRPG
jgi:hypothetical protein